MPDASDRRHVVSGVRVGLIGAAAAIALSAGAGAAQAAPSANWCSETGDVCRNLFVRSDGVVIAEEFLQARYYSRARLCVSTPARTRGFCRSVPLRRVNAAGAHAARIGLGRRAGVYTLRTYEGRLRIRVRAGARSAGAGHREMCAACYPPPKGPLLGPTRAAVDPSGYAPPVNGRVDIDMSRVRVLVRPARLTHWWTMDSRVEVSGIRWSRWSRDLAVGVGRARDCDSVGCSGWAPGMRITMRASDLYQCGRPRNRTVRTYRNVTFQGPYGSPWRMRIAVFPAMVPDCRVR